MLGLESELLSYIHLKPENRLIVHLCNLPNMRRIFKMWISRG